MAENSAIEWCDHTFNPWIGCTKIGTGCKHCYAERLNERYSWTEWGPGGERYLTGQKNWDKPHIWNRKQAKLEQVNPSAALLRPKVFCASLADVFDDHSSIKTEWKTALWHMIWETPYLTWLLLTKRPQNISDGLTIPNNVWIGISASNGDELDILMPHIRNKTIHKLFVSFEPLLGPVKLAPWHNIIDWVIVGGESGLHARPMPILDVDDISVQCRQHNIPYFFKQHGEWISRSMINWNYIMSNKINLDPLPEDNSDSPELYIKVGKKNAEVYSRRNSLTRREFPQVEK